MNKFWVNEERHLEFEDVWTKRDRHLKGVSGFQSFKLLKGEAKDGRRAYISHSSWEDEESFWAWTKSEAFKLAHKNRTPEGIIVGPPEFGGYSVILED